MMLFGTHPLMAYAIVGLGAAAYSPAKYGILTELLPASQLVKANGWIEGLTIASIILGVLLGGQLVGPHVASALLAIDMPLITTGIDTAPEAAIGADFCLHRGGLVQHPHSLDRRAHAALAQAAAVTLLPDFWICNLPPVARQTGPDFAGCHHAVLGRGGNLRFIVLAWAAAALGYSRDAGLGPGWRGGHWHRRGRGGGFHAHAAGPRPRGHAAGHWHGFAGHLLIFITTCGWRHPF
jgi:LPLT family lysophospholipid transporter-like MFS transporter